MLGRSGRSVTRGVLLFFACPPGVPFVDVRFVPIADIERLSLGTIPALILIDDRGTDLQK